MIALTWSSPACATTSLFSLQARTTCSSSAFTWVSLAGGIGVSAIIFCASSIPAWHCDGWARAGRAAARKRARAAAIVRMAAVPPAQPTPRGAIHSSARRAAPRATGLFEGEGQVLPLGRRVDQDRGEPLESLPHHLVRARAVAPDDLHRSRHVAGQHVAQGVEVAPE